MSTSLPLGVTSLDVPAAATRVPRARMRATTATAVVAAAVLSHEQPSSTTWRHDAMAAHATMSHRNDNDESSNNSSSRNGCRNGVTAALCAATPPSVKHGSSDVSLPSPLPRPVHTSVLTTTATTTTAVSTATLPAGLVASSVATERVTHTQQHDDAGDDGVRILLLQSRREQAPLSSAVASSSARASPSPSYAGTSPLLLLPVSPRSSDGGDAHDLVCRVLSTAATSTSSSSSSQTTAAAATTMAATMAATALSWLRFVLEHKREQLRCAGDAHAHTAHAHHDVRHCHDVDAAVTSLLRDVHALQQLCGGRLDACDEQQQQQQRQLCVHVSNALAALAAAEDSLLAYRLNDHVARSTITSLSSALRARDADAAHVEELRARYEAMTVYSVKLQRRLHALQQSTQSDATTTTTAATSVAGASHNAAVVDTSSAGNDNKSGSRSNRNDDAVSSSAPAAAATTRTRRSVDDTDDADVLRGALARYAARVQDLRVELAQAHDDNARLRATVATLRANLAQHRRVLDELQHTSP